MFLGSIFYGLIMEFTTGMLISRSYIQGEFTVMVEAKELLGYGTDMPLYVALGFYPVIIFLGFKLIESSDPLDSGALSFCGSSCC